MRKKAVEKLPFMKVFPTDMLADQQLARCSLAAQGLWWRCRLLAHLSRRRGFLIEGLDCSKLHHAREAEYIEVIARLVGQSPEQILPLLLELQSAGPLDREKSTRFFYVPLAVREERKRKADARNGKSKIRPKRKKSGPNLIRDGPLGENPDTDPRLEYGMWKASPACAGLEGGGAGGVRTEAVKAAAIFDAYPRRVGRKAALPAIATALREIELRGEAAPAAWLAERVRLYAEHIRATGTETRYIPYPATWFGAARYDDDLKTNGAVKHGNAARYHSGTDWDEVQRRRTVPLRTGDTATGDGRRKGG